MAAKPLARALLAVAVLGLDTLAIAHEEPAGCQSAGVALVTSLYRADGTTPFLGFASECERIVYRIALYKGAPSVCAFSNGTLTLTTADGVAHRLADPVPCIGGDAAEGRCAPARDGIQSPLVPYAIRPQDVVNGVIKAITRYEGGVAHDSPDDTPGISAVVDRNAQIVSCGDADPCTYDHCDPMKAGLAACSNPPLCDDGDPTTSDSCTRGQCAFTPIASSDRTVCGAAN